MGLGSAFSLISNVLDFDNFVYKGVRKKPTVFKFKICPIRFSGFFSIRYFFITGRSVAAVFDTLSMGYIGLMAIYRRTDGYGYITSDGFMNSVWDLSRIILLDGSNFVRILFTVYERS